MKFDNETSILQQKIANGYAGVSRRLAIINALDLEIGFNSIDIGCGGGHLVKEIALGVGEKGKSIGIDPSQDQLDAANKRCKELKNIELICCSADNIKIEDKFCDRITSTQTLEYIKDIDSSLKELKRISKKNSKFVNISILWDYFRFYGPEKKLNDLIHEAFRAHCFHQMLPLDLIGKLSNLGYQNIESENLSYLITKRDKNSPAIFYERMLAKFAISQGIEEDKVDDWQKQIKQAENSKNFGFTSFPVLTKAYTN
tara:strand:+ start:1822 stop:2592 length:771 start_codon:yes stop_codon:yes gene_type:complete